VRLPPGHGRQPFFWFYLDLYLVSDTKYKVRLEQTKNLVALFCFYAKEYYEEFLKFYQNILKDHVTNETEAIIELTEMPS
jgi:hypothetical protein